MTPLRWTVLATQVPAGGSLGGVVRYTMEFMRALADRSDVEVSALTTRAAAQTVAELLGDRARVSTVPDAPTIALSLAERYAPLSALRDGADVVHGVKHLLPRHSTALRVLTVHDMLLLDRPQDFGTAKRVLLPASYRGSIRDADLLLCVSDATRRRVASQVPGAEARAAVVHLATSTSLRTARPEPLAALADKSFALVVGDPTPRKNLRTVMLAWTKIRAELKDTVLAIAGPPSWGRSVFGGTYDTMVAAGDVVPLGHITDAELRWAYEHAGVVLCPSLAEGFGLPAAEALDFGAPVIISADPALREVCAGRALAEVPSLDVDRWAAAIMSALQDPARVPATPGRTWADVVEDSVRAVRKAVITRSGPASA